MRSPVIPSSSRCLELSFHYYLYGTSTTMELSVHTITAGGSLGSALFTVKGNQGQHWLPADVRLQGTADTQNHVHLMQSIKTVVQLVSLHAWNLPPTALGLVSVVVSVNPALSSRDVIVFHWINVAPGEIVSQDGCSKLCRCLGNYTFECVDNSCDPTEECQEVNGVSSCYPKGTSTCVASGDPHYTTFDKHNYNFMGNCSYLMSAPCNDTIRSYFEVHTDNENRFNSPTISYVKAVHVYVYMMKISILKGGTVQVNGTNVNLPVNPDPDVSVFMSGKHYTPGEEFYVEDCKLKCRCDAPSVTCHPSECPPMHECKVQDGDLGCYPTGSQDCVVSGDPHYNTFDKKFYSFMGTCTYTLARTCKNNTGPWFSVEAKNENRGAPGLSYLRKLYITVNGITVTLMKSRRTLVNGVRVALPHSPSPLMSLSLAGQYVTFETPFGLRVRWDGNHYAQISVPSSYYDQMCGLCGDYDGNPDNDFTKPDGTLVGNVNDFGNSWETEEDEDDSCTPNTKPDPDCDPSLEAELEKPDKCGKIKDPTGPF
ncbi:hypothetical protein XENORESO_007647, partial [Xenotaenia resolanae]